MTMGFAASARSTLGVEWELQLVDQDSNDLRQSADAVIERATVNGNLHPNVHREMLLNTVEVTSEPRTKVSECIKDLTDTIAFLEPITDSLRIDLASAGTHPFARPAHQLVTDSRRYAELVERTQYWGRQMLLYGVHVHVGVEDRAKVLPLQSAMTTHLGHMQALAAASPFWAGIDTGYASNRAMVFQQLPTAGIPRQFDTWEDLESYAESMITAGIVSGFDEVRWDIRPSPALGTIEVRAFDAATNIFEVEAFAALTHCLVEFLSRRLDAGEELESLPDWFVAENKWRSARYGLDADLIVDAQGATQCARDTIGEHVAKLVPVARHLDCERELSNVLTILEVGAAYERQRAVAAAFDSEEGLGAVVSHMRAEHRAGHPIEAEDFLSGYRPSHGAASTSE
ncbi:glutamate--cysteine ligase [Schaalia vaccimaxillae]|uniref:glutamate--cysteine ligase n=1 Tax=Schaalia vaccimaxillae TaxID=183916 RepID=UPI0003B70F93|nr:glutamate--cysteine ligase [Schaalia vaccimaxillae]